MKTISNREFVANPELYLGMATEQDVRITKGRRVFHLTCEPEHDLQPVLQPDDELRRAITCEELLRRIDEDLDRKWAERRK
jgi:hypothetical protein